MLFGQKTIYDKLLRLFLDTRRTVADEIGAAFERGDRASASLNAHSLKSSAGTIGAEELSQAAAAIESALSSGELDPALLERLSLACRRVVAGLEQYFLDE